MRSTQAPHLTAVRDAVPEFADIDFLLGRYAVDIPAQPDQEEALRRFTAARAAFPESPPSRQPRGAAPRSRGVDGRARSVRRDAGLVPTHRDALLGRAVTLSHLARHDEAVAAATRILELGSWFTGEAYYWRAWNEYHLARIEEARSTPIAPKD
jgi:tetratricopeptide (TPR) repeat protein